MSSGFDIDFDVCQDAYNRSQESDASQSKSWLHLAATAQPTTQLSSLHVFMRPNTSDADVAWQVRHSQV